MKKIIALLLILSVAAVSTACGEKNTNEQNVITGIEDKNQEESAEKTSSPEDEIELAKASVDAFLKGYTDFDIEEMSEFCNTDIAKRLKTKDYSEYIDSKIEAYFDGDKYETVFAADIDRLQKLCKDAVLKNASYEIGEGKFADGKWSFDVKAGSVKLDSIFAILHGDKAEKLTQELLDEFILKLSDPSLTEEQVTEIADKMLNVSLTAIVELITESCENAKPEQSEYIIAAIKDGDTWKVDAENGGGAEIIESLTYRESNE